MEQEVNTTVWSKTKRNIIYTLIGVVIALSGTAVFVPTAREYIITIVKLILETVKMFVISP